MKYIWHIELDMLMKYKLCRNNEKFRQTKPIKLSNVLTKIDTRFDSDEFSAIALLQGERVLFCFLSYISFLGKQQMKNQILKRLQPFCVVYILTNTIF